MGLRSLIRKIVQWSVRENDTEEAEPRNNRKNLFANLLNDGHNPGYDHPSNFESSNVGMNFTIYRANGGTILQLYSYDRQTDKTKSDIFIIDDKEKLGEQIELIITRTRIAN